jgi:hypothetical protein
MKPENPEGVILLQKNNSPNVFKSRRDEIIIETKLIKPENPERVTQSRIPFKQIFLIKLYLKRV